MSLRVFFTHDKYICAIKVIKRLLYTCTEDFFCFSDV